MGLTEVKMERDKVCTNSVHKLLISSQSYYVTLQYYRGFVIRLQMQ